jgi:copper resistance protein D
MIDWPAVAARAGGYLSLGLLAGLVLYRCLVTRDNRSLPRSPVAALAITAFASSVLWLFAIVAAMTERPLYSPDWAILSQILLATPIGWALIVRLVAIGLIAILPARPLLLAGPASVALASLAWTGHGSASEGVPGWIHLGSDILHLLAAATWLGALASFLAGAIRKPSDVDLSQRLAQFAWPGSVIVAVLVVTGFFDLIMIVGLPGLSTLLATTYGSLLAAKLALFAAMLVMAGINRWKLTPMLRATPADTLGKLRMALASESGAWLGIALIVSILGTLDPMA